MPRLAAPGPPPSPVGAAYQRGVRTYRENLIFSIWPLLSADKKAIKNEKGGGGSPGASHSTDQPGRSGSEFVAMCGAQSPAPEWGHPASPTRCLAPLCQDRPGSGKPSPKPMSQVFAPSPFTHFLNLEIQHFKAREDRRRSSGWVP